MRRLGTVSQALQVALGLWLMAAPALLGTEGSTAEISSRIVGPLVVSFSFIAFWQVVRAVRFFNWGAALWLWAAPWILGYEMPAMLNSILVATALFLLTPLARPQTKSFAGGWRSLARSRF